MKATDFEYRHRMLLHLAVVSIAFLTYLVDRDDILWALVRGHHDARLLERVGFTVATLLIGVGTALRTWGRARQLAEGSDQGRAFERKSYSRHLRYRLHVGNLIFAIGLASLAPFRDSSFLRLPKRSSFFD